MTYPRLPPRRAGSLAAGLAIVAMFAISALIAMGF
jgi:hypothetical protein